MWCNLNALSENWFHAAGKLGRCPFSTLPEMLIAEKQLGKSFPEGRANVAAFKSVSGIGEQKAQLVTAIISLAFELETLEVLLSHQRHKCIRQLNLSAGAWFQRG